MTATKQAAERRILFASSDVYEAAVALKYAEAKGLKKPVTGIPLNKLTPDMVICPIVRDSSRTPLRYEEFDRQLGRPQQRQRKPEELIGEVRECEPIAVAKYWSADQQKVAMDDFAELLGGGLLVNEFIDAVNRSTAVHEVFARTHHGDENNTLTLNWGA